MDHVRIGLVVVSLAVLSACTRTCPEPTRAGLRSQARFDVALTSIAPTSAHPELQSLPSCRAIDGVGVGTTVSITTTDFGGLEGACVLAGTVDSPTLTILGTAIRGPAVHDLQFWTGRRVDLGAGCTGAWDFGLASAATDGGAGGVIAIRRFRPDSPDACSSTLGATTECGDDYFATISPTEWR